MKSTIEGNIEINIKNIGGLSHFNKTIGPGLNVIEEPNAFGKTSFLRAISLLVTTSGNHSELNHILKLDEEEGSISIESIHDTLLKKIIKSDKAMIVEGEDLFNEKDSNLIKKFAIGGSDNEILTAVRDGKNLKELLTDEINTDQMRDRLKRSENAIEELEQVIEALENDDSKLPGKIVKKEKNEKKIIELKEKKTKLGEDIKKLAHTANKNDKITKKFKELSQEHLDIKKTIAETESLLKNNQKEIERLREKKANLLKEQPEDSKPTLSKSEIKKKLDELQESINPLESNYSALSLFIDGTRKMLSHLTPAESSSDILSSLSDTKITDSSEILCPCCSKKTTVKELDQQIESYINKANEIKKQIDSTKDEIKKLTKEEKNILQKEADLSENKTRLIECKNEIAILEDAIIERENLIKTKKEEFVEIKNEMDAISKKIDTRHQDLTNQQEDINNQIGQLENENKKLEKTIATLMDQKELLPIKKEELKKANQLRDEHQKAITHAETRLVNQFNDAIKKVYASLKLDVNFHEIRLTENYNIVVSRKSNDSDKPIKDYQPIKTLSKSELEIIGLIVMLSGYVINELKTKFPYIVLDELTFLDSERLSKLMSYILPYTDSVILTKLPSGELTI
jgi:DNA repair exonuclease SbcCD ATPase subunit